MATYRYRQKPIRRLGGPSPAHRLAYQMGAQVQEAPRRAATCLLAKLAYQAADRIEVAPAYERHLASVAVAPDRRVYDYRGKRGVHGTRVLVPDDAPEWARDPATLLMRADLAEKRRDAVLALSLDIMLPREPRIDVASRHLDGFLERQFVSRGLAVVRTIHLYGTLVDPSVPAVAEKLKREGVLDLPRYRLDDVPAVAPAVGPHVVVVRRRGCEQWAVYQPHAHAIATVRPLLKAGFGSTKSRDVWKKRFLYAGRQGWEAAYNDALGEAGVAERVSAAAKWKQHPWDAATPQRTERDPALTQLCVQGGHHAALRGKATQNTGDRIMPTDFNVMIASLQRSHRMPPGEFRSRFGAAVDLLEAFEGKAVEFYEGPGRTLHYNLVDGVTITSEHREVWSGLHDALLYYIEHRYDRFDPVTLRVIDDADDVAAPQASHDPAPAEAGAADPVPPAPHPTAPVPIYTVEHDGTAASALRRVAELMRDGVTVSAVGAELRWSDREGRITERDRAAFEIHDQTIRQMVSAQDAGRRDERRRRDAVDRLVDTAATAMMTQAASGAAFRLTARGAIACTPNTAVPPDEYRRWTGHHERIFERFSQLSAAAEVTALRQRVATLEAERCAANRLAEDLACARAERDGMAAETRRLLAALREEAERRTAAERLLAAAAVPRPAAGPSASLPEGRIREEADRLTERRLGDILAAVPAAAKAFLPHVRQEAAAMRIFLLIEHLCAVIEKRTADAETARAERNRARDEAERAQRRYEQLTAWGRDLIGRLCRRLTRLAGLDVLWERAVQAIASDRQAPPVAAFVDACSAPGKAAPPPKSMPVAEKPAAQPVPVRAAAPVLADADDFDGDAPHVEHRPNREAMEADRAVRAAVATYVTGLTPRGEPITDVAVESRDLRAAMARLEALDPVLAFRTLDELHAHALKRTRCRPLHQHLAEGRQRAALQIGHTRGFGRVLRPSESAEIQDIVRREELSRQPRHRGERVR